jgi:hypothetical protein
VEALVNDFVDGLSSVSAPGSEERPAFFTQDGETYLPQEASRSPWNPTATNGVAVAGLLMLASEQARSPGPMIPAHVVIDILRPVPFGPTLPHTVVTRDGKKMQMVETHLMEGDTPVARARVLRVRETESPHIEAPMTYPSPEEAPRRPFLEPPVRIAKLVETRLVAGEIDETGPATVWTRLRADVVAGLPISPVVHATMISDFGNGLSRPADPRKWTFANVDISLHMVRRPVGDWLLVDADAMLQGCSVGLTNMILADRAGPFGRAHQTVFIAPRG